MTAHETSPWIEAAILPRFPPLQGNTRADVVIVGAGIAGLTAAYTLAGVGHDVLVLDQGQLPDCQTVRSTGHLCTAMDEGYAALEHTFGIEGARKVALSHCAAIQAIDDISRNERIECGFMRVDGYLVQGNGDGGELAEEHAAAARAGLDVERVPAAPGAFSGFGPAVRFARQARISAPRYLAGLADAVQRRGVRIHGDTQVARVEGGSDAGVTLGDGRRVRANSVVVAANVAFAPELGLTARQSACRTYVIALGMDAGAVPDELCWVGPPPGRYIRTAHEADGHWLVVGGEDGTDNEHDAARRYDALETWTRRHFPMAGAVGHRWSGALVHPRDSLAGIGRNPGLPGNVFISTGDSGNGLTHGTLTGLILPELLEGRDSPFEALYAPGRWGATTG